MSEQISLVGLDRSDDGVTCDRGVAVRKRRAVDLSLLDLATMGCVVAWLAVACYAVAYLVSH